tara:strand:- start:1530 stop:2099 length:570 start_codon:yes stop_codon:yes gene_type:complete
MEDEQEKLNIQDLAQSSIEDENQSMFDLDDFRVPEIDFGSPATELEEQVEQEEDVHTTDEEVVADDAKIDFQSAEFESSIMEQSYDLGETIAEKTEVAIINTVSNDRITDIKKEYESFGLQSSPEPGQGKREVQEAVDARGVMAASPMDFDADKFPPQVGVRTPPSSSAIFKVRGSSDIKVGQNPFGYA